MKKRPKEPSMWENEKLFGGDFNDEKFNLKGFLISSLKDRKLGK